MNPLQQRELVLVVSRSARCCGVTAQAHPRGWPECAGGARQASGPMLFGANEHHAHPALKDESCAMQLRSGRTSRGSWIGSSVGESARLKPARSDARYVPDPHQRLHQKGDRSARLQLVDGVRSEACELAELPAIIAVPNDGGDACGPLRAVMDIDRPESSEPLSQGASRSRSHRSRDGVERHALRPDGHALRGLGIPTRRAMVAHRDRSQRGGFDSRTGLQRRSRWIAR